VSFVGRGDELAVLDGAIADALAGRTRFVLLTGEPGAGKTTLAFEAARRAASRGARTAAGRAWEGAGAPAFWVWQECMRELGAVSRLPGSGVTDETRFAALSMITETVRSSAASTPIVLVFDDAQWSDVPSLLALKLLARTARNAKLCVIVTMREPNEAAADIRATLAELRREALVLSIGGLSRDALAELARSGGLDGAPAIDALEKATAGNALFVVEMLSDGAARASLDAGAPVDIPHGVREILLRHLGRLAERVREVTTWAAVGGDPIDVAAIAAAADLPFSVVDEAIATACREQVLTRADGSLRFAHDLLRAAARDEAPHETRVRMHEAFARVLDPLSVARIHHLLASDPHAETTAAAALAAARAALKRLAYEDAALLARSAKQITERSPSTVAFADACSVLAEAIFLTGDVEAALRESEQALAAARAAGDAAAFARAAWTMGLRRTPGQSSRDLAAVLDEALAKLDPTADVALRCTIEARLASALQPMIDPVRAIDLARRVLERARTMNDPELLARAIHSARPALRMLEPLDERRALDLELVDLAARLGDDPLAAHAHVRTFWTSLEAGDALQADQSLHAVESLAAKTRIPTFELMALVGRAVRALMEGRFAETEAAALAMEATRERWAQSFSGGFGVDLPSIVRANLATLRGEMIEYPRSVPVPFRTMLDTFALARAGRLQEAAQALSMLPPNIVDEPPGGLAYAMRINLGEVAARVRHVEYARRFYELCLPFEGRHIVWTPMPGYDGAMDRLLGSLADVLGDRAGALRHYDAAIAMEERLGAVAFAERSRSERAQLAPTSVRVTRAAVERPTFVHEGDTWLVTFGGESTRMKDADGLRYLATLIAKPNVPVPVMELFAARDSARGEAVPVAFDGGEVLDREAIAAYRRRADELREMLEDAEARNDVGRAERARVELAFLEDELARCGPRRAGPSGELRSGEDAHQCNDANS
jgi:tetratricopeptide (TPR) repeat protein